MDRERGSATRAIVEAQLGATSGVVLEPGAAVLEAGSVAALVAAVAAGMGVGFCLAPLGGERARRRRVREVPIDAVQIPRRFFVAWRREAALSEPAARRFLALARRAAGSERP